MACFSFLDGLLGLRSEALRSQPNPPKPAQSVAPLLPAELVEEIISFVPPIVQEVRYKTEIPAPKGIDVTFSGNYSVTFKGGIFVGGKAHVHLSVIDERKDGLTKFPTYDYEWLTEVIAISDEGVHLARGDDSAFERRAKDETSYTIRQPVVCGRLLKSLDDLCSAGGSLSSESDNSRKTLKRSESF